MKLLSVCIMVVSLCLAAAWSSVSAEALATSDGPVNVANWGYQLQGEDDSALSHEAIAAAPHDLMVIDFSGFGDEGSKFTPTQVAAMKQRPGGAGRRVLSAYVSIGEASEFRSYWDDTPGAWTIDGTASGSLATTAPTWLGPTNPDWPESRKVRYWETGWQSVLYNDAGTGWLDQVVMQGFDAAYLDIVDAYYFWGEEATPSQKSPGDPQDAQDAARRMVDLIVAMTAHARQSNPSFFVIPQNGAFILNDMDFAGSLAEDPARRAAFLDAVSAIAVEDVFFGGDADENNPYGPDDETITVLQQDFLAAGKPVFAVDYLNDASLVERFFGVALEEGFVPYAAGSRGLDTLGPPVPEPGAAGLLGVSAVAAMSRPRRPR